MSGCHDGDGGGGGGGGGIVPKLVSNHSSPVQCLDVWTLFSGTDDASQGDAVGNDFSMSARLVRTVWEIYGV